MPFKTPHGSHYHMTEGCHGATIPCDTTGLTPCSDCCGTQGEASHGGSSSGLSAGASSPSGQDEGRFKHYDETATAPGGCTHQDEVDRGIVTDGNRISDAGLDALASGNDAPSVTVDADAVRRFSGSPDILRNLHSNPMLVPPMTRRKVLYRLSDDEVPEPIAGHTDDRTSHEVADSMGQDVALLSDVATRIRKSKGRTAGILDEVAQHMREVSDQMRAGADGQGSSFDRARAFRVLNLDVVRLEGDIDYMRDFGDEEGRAADVATEVARHLHDTLDWIRLDTKWNGR